MHGRVNDHPSVFSFLPTKTLPPHVPSAQVAVIAAGAMTLFHDHAIDDLINRQCTADDRFYIGAGVIDFDHSVQADPVIGAVHGERLNIHPRSLAEGAGHFFFDTVGGKQAEPRVSLRFFTFK